MLFCAVLCRAPFPCQTVVLYDFWSDSSLQHHLRVIYSYMQERGLPGAPAGGFPAFSPEVHGGLCADLKQWYVLVTRARQEVVVFEASEESAGPLRRLWEALGLVETCAGVDEQVGVWAGVGAWA